jgi:dipeptide transport system permease protein
LFTFLLKRIALVLPTFLGITLLVFALIHLLLGEHGMTAERYARLIHEFGLDRPLPVQCADDVSKAVRGDLGLSTITHEPVFKVFITLFPATVEWSVCVLLMALLMALLMVLLLGLPTAIMAAVKRNTFWDYSVMGALLTGDSMPIFWWGLLLILTFSVGLGWTPVSGRIAIQFDLPPVTGLMLIDSLLSGEKGAFKSACSHSILPSIALIPVVTTIGLQVGTLLAGAILTETIFSWPGIGKWLVEAIHRRDYPAAQGGILLSATVIVAVNLVVDVLYGVINPRIRHA